jgi:hypothetical protein
VHRVYASQGRIKYVNKGKRGTFQVEATVFTRREEECKQRETRDLRSGRGASRSSDIIVGKKRIYIPL